MVTVVNDRICQLSRKKERTRTEGALTLECLGDLVRVELLGVLVASLDGADLHGVPCLLGDLDAGQVGESQGVVVHLLEVRLQERVNNVSQARDSPTCI